MQHQRPDGFERTPKALEDAAALRRYWDKLRAGGVLPRTVDHVVYVPFEQHFHSSHTDSEVYGLGEMLHLAETYDDA